MYERAREGFGRTLAVAMDVRALYDGLYSLKK